MKKLLIFLLLVCASVAQGQIGLIPTLATPSAPSCDAGTLTVTADSSATQTCVTSDGSDPVGTINSCTNGAAYTAPIVVSSTTTYKVKSFSPYRVPSATYSKTCTIATGYSEFGFDFRGTVGFVNDDTNCPITGHCASVTTAVVYPTTNSTFGTKYGYDGATGVTFTDRGPYDSRVSGVAYNGTTIRTFRIDLPSTGTYKIWAAFGDVDNGGSAWYAEFKDDTTSFKTVNATSINGLLDASGADWNGSNWPVSNVPLTRSFASNCSTGDTTKPCLIIQLSNGTVSGAIEHVYIQKQ